LAPFERAFTKWVEGDQSIPAVTYSTNMSEVLDLLAASITVLRSCMSRAFLMAVARFSSFFAPPKP
jgi:hypothetical protein